MCVFNILVKFEWLSGHHIVLGKWLPILLAPFPDRCLLLLITIPCSSCTSITVNHCHCSRRMFFSRGEGATGFPVGIKQF